MDAFFVYLIIMAVIFIARSAGSNKKGQAKRPPARPAQPSKAAPAQPAAAPQAARPERKPLTQEELKKAVRLIMEDRMPVKPSPAPKAVQPAQPARPPMEAPAADDPGFYQGRSFGDEGVDPCHDDLYEDRRTAGPEAAPAEQPGFSLRFTADSVLNGIIMSEVLKKRE